MGFRVFLPLRVMPSTRPLRGHPFPRPFSKLPEPSLGARSQEPPACRVVRITFQVTRAHRGCLLACIWGQGASLSPCPLLSLRTDLEFLCVLDTEPHKGETVSTPRASQVCVCSGEPPGERAASARVKATSCGVGVAGVSGFAWSWWSPEPSSSPCSQESCVFAKHVLFLEAPQCWVLSSPEGLGCRCCASQRS